MNKNETEKAFDINSENHGKIFVLHNQLMQGLTLSMIKPDFPTESVRQIEDELSQTVSATPNGREVLRDIFELVVKKQRRYSLVADLVSIHIPTTAQTELIQNQPIIIVAGRSNDLVRV